MSNNLPSTEFQMIAETLSVLSQNNSILTQNMIKNNVEFDNFKNIMLNMNKDMISIKDFVQTLDKKVDTECYINGLMKRNIRELINNKVNFIIDNENIEKSMQGKAKSWIYKSLYRYINNYYCVSTYLELPRSKYEEIIDKINNYEIDNNLRNRIVDLKLENILK